MPPNKEGVRQFLESKVIPSNKADVS